MSYRNKTYVAFDGDTDIQYYRLMQAWKANEKIDFNFYDAHDINSARDGSTEDSIKAQLRERMANSKQVILLVGEKTRLLRKFVPWEIELARKKDLPLILVNLNKSRRYDEDRCPAAVKDGTYTISVPFGVKPIKYALDDFPTRYAQYRGKPGYGHDHSYRDSTYDANGL